MQLQRTSGIQNDFPLKLLSTSSGTRRRLDLFPSLHVGVGLCPDTDVGAQNPLWLVGREMVKGALPIWTAHAKMTPVKELDACRSPAGWGDPSLARRSVRGER